MKIAYLNTFYAPDEIGGAEKSVRFLAETMIARGHQATVIVLGRARDTSQLNGVKIERVPTRNLYFPSDAGKKSALEKILWHSVDSYNLAAAHHVGRLLDDIKPDVLHSNNIAGFSAAIWGAARDRKIPIVHTLRDYYLLCSNTAMFKNGNPCENRCLRCKVLAEPRARATSRVNYIVGNSAFILKKHLEFGLFSGIPNETIYNAYQPKRLESLRASDKITFGFIGRLAPSKGLEFLIKSMRAIKVELSKYELLVAGEGEVAYVKHIKELAKGLPVRFVGRVAPEEFYAQVHWTVVPSLWDEPLARVIFESFAHGVPVIGSATGGTPELVRPSENGFLFDIDSPDRLTALLENALSCDNNKYSQLSQQASIDGRRFVPKNVADKYLRIYEKLTANADAARISQGV